jgi:hypothetical protein
MLLANEIKWFYYIYHQHLLAPDDLMTENIEFYHFMMTLEAFTL